MILDSIDNMDYSSKPENIDVTTGQPYFQAIEPNPGCQHIDIIPAL